MFSFFILLSLHMGTHEHHPSLPHSHTYLCLIGSSCR